MSARALGWGLITTAAAPISAVGLGITSLRNLLWTRRTGSSATAMVPLLNRWILAELGLRPDPWIGPMLMALPGISPRGLRAALGPSLWATRQTGFAPRYARYPSPDPSSLLDQVLARTAFIDQALAERAAPQVVFLGAGFDTRALGLATTRCFEVDQPATQSAKRAALAQAGADTSHVTFVPVDFEQRSWREALHHAGLAPELDTFFVWEGVSYYLEPETVDATLGELPRSTASGSVALDYFTPSLIQGAGLEGGALRRAIALTQEPMRFGATADNMEARLGAAGQTVQAHQVLGRPPWGGLIQGGWSPATD